MQLIHKHWTEGGTGVTNTDADQLPIYQEAVRRYGNRNGHQLVMSDLSMSPKCGGLSLHDLSFLDRTRKGSLDEFWAIFDRVRKEMEPPKPDAHGWFKHTDKCKPKEGRMVLRYPDGEYITITWSAADCSRTAFTHWRPCNIKAPVNA